MNFTDGKCPSVVADIVFILDDSTSIVYAQGGYNNWYDDILEFAANLTEIFSVSPTQTRFGAIEFSDSASVEFYLSDYTNNRVLSEAILNLNIIGGETNIADALELAR